MFKANSSYSVLSNKDLIMLLEKKYNIKNVNSFHLHRSFIGDVYFVKTDKKSYTMKIFKNDSLHNSNIENSVDVIDYLWEKGLPVPEIIKNIDNFKVTKILAPEGQREIVVTSYIDGELALESDNEIDKKIGEQSAKMRDIMTDYPNINRLQKIDEDELIDRFIKVMYKYFPNKDEEITFFKSYGEFLSKKIKELYSKYPQSIGFCHGDFHNGNIIKISDTEVKFIDFDACGIGCTLTDIATYCNEMDYFRFEKSKILATQKKLEVFLEKYSEIFSLSQYEIDSIPLFIALRHYELNATVPLNRVPIEGRHWLNDNWLKAQYSWLKEWQSIYHSI